MRVGEGTLLMATPCLGPSGIVLNKKKINIFCLMHITLFLKVTLSRNFVEKKFIFYTVFLGKSLFR